LVFSKKNEITPLYDKIIIIYIFIGKKIFDGNKVPEKFNSKCFLEKEIFFYIFYGNDNGNWMPLNSHVLRLFQEKINLDFYFFFLLIESFFFLASKTIVAISFCLFSFILFFFSLILKNFPSIKISMLFIHPVITIFTSLLLSFFFFFFFKASEDDKTKTDNNKILFSRKV